MLDDRKSSVLQALVEEYIRSGEPVSSQAILDRSGLSVSSATIRNDLAKLEAYGFVAQPHTSAGRVPTPSGYRFYVDHCSPARLRATTHARIESFFHEVHEELGRLLEETSGLLSEITHFPAVVIGPEPDADTIHAIHIVRLGGSSVLVVTVAEHGRVIQQPVTLDFEPTDVQLQEAERIVEAIYLGRAVPDASDDDRLRASDVSDVVRRIVDPVHSELQRSDRLPREVFVGGSTQLVELWSDLEIVQRMLGLLDRKTELQSLLESEGRGTSVRIGNEVADRMDIAIVSTPVGSGIGAGRVGVIGPMRMDYRRTIRVVEEVGEGLEDRFGVER
jgi:heat-inducible transcriptional repressor